MINWAGVGKNRRATFTGRYWLTSEGCRIELDGFEQNIHAASWRDAEPLARAEIATAHGIPTDAVMLVLRPGHPLG